MKPNLKINGQQTMRVNAPQPIPQMVLFSIALSLDGGPTKHQGVTNGRRI